MSDYSDTLEAKRPLVEMWLQRNARECRDKAAGIQRQIDVCKTEWWPAQLAILRDAHNDAAKAYDAALANARVQS